MENKEKKVLSDEGLQQVTGGVLDSCTMTPCQTLMDKESCEKQSVCVWTDNKCDFKSVRLF